MKLDGEDPSDYKDGTVFLGLRLLVHEYQKEQSFAVPTIMAHEFAHVMQAQRDFPYLARKWVGGVWKQWANGKWKELHADYMSGWYTAYRTRHGIQDPYHSLVSLIEKGDNSFTSPDHHGTPRERGLAFLNGYKYRGRASSAYDSGIQYIDQAGAIQDYYSSLESERRFLVEDRKRLSSAKDSDYDRQKLTQEHNVRERFYEEELHLYTDRVDNARKGHRGAK